MMRSLLQRLLAGFLLAGMLLALSGCGGSEDRIVIGTKFDQPGLAVKKPDGSMAGFDVDVATYVAGKLGYAPDQIEWKEAPSGQRETLIQNNTPWIAPSRK